MPIGVQFDGSFANTQRFLTRLKAGKIAAVLDKYGPKGVEALRAATPIETSATANSWTYEIVRGNGTYEIIWKNTHIVNGANIALLIQYGHGTGTGGYVPSHDYVNPAMKPIFEAIIQDVRKAVSSK